MLLLPGLGIGSVFAAGTVYWTDKNDATIWRGDMDGIGSKELLLDRSDGLSDPRGLGLDVAAGKMYWADAGSGTIRRANLDGSGIDNLLSGLPFLGDLELDVAAGKMYWADTFNASIWCANLDGSGAVSLFPDLGSMWPYYLELDIPGGAIYWGEIANTTIYRGSMSGTGPVEEIVTGLDTVRDVGLDLANNTIYYNERNLNQVRRTVVGSGTLQTLFSVPDGGKPHGMALDVADRMIYWTTTRTDSVMRGNMDGSGGFQVLYTSPGAPWDIEIVVPEPSTDGDQDGDGDVDDRDLNLLLSDFASPSNLQNRIDLRALLDNFGRPDLGALADVESVPEPSTLVLAVVALTGLLACGLRRRRLRG